MYVCMHGWISEHRTLRNTEFHHPFDRGRNGGPTYKGCYGLDKCPPKAPVLKACSDVGSSGTFWQLGLMGGP
jgi:hypothetical protein